MCLTQPALLVFLSIWLVSVPTRAQQQSPQRDPQALAIVARALAVMGAGSAIQDSQTTGSISIAGEASPYPIRLLSKGTTNIRIETQSPSGTTVLVLNQGIGVVTELSGKTRRISRNNTFARRVSHIPSLSLLASYLDSRTGVRYLRADVVAGRMADVVELTLNDNTQQVNPYLAEISRTAFSIDQANGTVTRVQYSRFAENSYHKQKMEVFLSNYQNHSGVLVPHLQRTIADGALESELSVQTVQFNVGLSDLLFALPGG